MRAEFSMNLKKRKSKVGLAAGLGLGTDGGRGKKFQGSDLLRDEVSVMYLFGTTCSARFHWGAEGSKVEVSTHATRPEELLFVFRF